MRAIALFSGGLDSILAAELVRRLGVEVIAMSFSSPFFDSSRAKRAAEQLRIELVHCDVTEEFLAMLPQPKYGYGANMNPCIDCRALMFRRAGQLMESLGADFIFSGEVLGQRPMSQNKQSLHISAKLSGFEDFILRPLSARLLPKTLVVREGKLDLDEFYGISGRGRQAQMQLAAQLGIGDYPSPGGGCRLTDPGFVRRLRRLLEAHPAPSVLQIELLKLGRHIRLGDTATLIVGRNELENERIESLALPDQTLLTVVGFMGPTGILTPPFDHEDLLLACSIVARYSDAPRGLEVHVLVTHNGERVEHKAVPIAPEKMQNLLI